jgi:hypothetical protein
LLKGFSDGLLALEKDGRLKGRFAGILHIVNDSLADAVISDRTEVLYGREYFYEEIRLCISRKRIVCRSVGV